MLRRLLAAFFLFAPVAVADDKKEDKKGPEFVVHTGHFEKNNSGLKDEPSLLLITSSDDFEKVFGTVPPAGLGGGGKKNNPVKKDDFDTEVVAAVIKRGKAITTYTEVSTKTDGETLTVSCKSVEGNAGTATFASPLIVSVPKGKVKTVVFVENGNEIGTAK